MSDPSRTRSRVLAAAAAAAAAGLTLLPAPGAHAAPALPHPWARAQMAASWARAHTTFTTTGTGTGTDPAPSACTSLDSFSPSTVVIGAKPVTKTFSVKVSGPSPACTLGDWFGAFLPFADLNNTTDTSTAGTIDNTSPKLTMSPKLLSNINAGKGKKITLSDGEKVNSNDTYFEAWSTHDDEQTTAPVTLESPITLLRYATWGTSFTTSPNRVKTGTKITLAGVLKRVNWAYNTKTKKINYVGYSGRDVRVQFEPAGTTTYITVKTVKTGTGGKLRTTVTDSGSGTWRLSFPGTSTTAPASTHPASIKVT